MNFEKLINLVLEETENKISTYKVSNYKYAFGGITKAKTKSEAIGHIAVRYARSKNLTNMQYAKMINDFKNTSKVREVEDK